MFLNLAWNTGGGGGGGGGTVINVTGSTNYIKTNIVDMNAIPSPKNGDICHVTSTKELYMYENGTWNIIPTSDMFYNKLSSTTQVGHVQLTSDITSDSEDKAITPKALKTAIDEVKTLINSDDTDGWGDFDDGIQTGEGEDNFEWGNFG